MNDLGRADHSELEVDQHRLQNLRIPRKPIAAHSAEKEAVQPSDNELVNANQANGVGDVNAANLPRRRNFWRKKSVIVIGIVLLCVVVGAVVGGAVGGTQHKSSKSSTPSTTASPSTTVSQTTSATVSHTSSATALPSSLVPRPNSNLAAVAWSVSDTLGQIRVYSQDDRGNIQEAARNTSDNTWTLKTLSNCTVPAKNGTTLAAAFRPQSQSSQDSQIYLYYLDASNSIQQCSWSIETEWRHSVVGLKASPSSALTVVWWQCALCSSSILLFYQDQDYNVQAANYTSSTWQNTTLPMTAAHGTGLAVQAYAIANSADSINLYYQRASDSAMCQCTWLPPQSFPQDPNVWKGEWAVFNQIPFLVPLATVAYGFTSIGRDLWIQLLQADPNYGVTVYPWWGETATWQTIEAPPAMANVQNYSSLAVTALQTAYALQNGTLVEFQVASDGITWTAIGPVSILA